MTGQTEIKKEKLLSRPPIVVVLGHVDHGKTKILDYIRKTKVAEKESGGITQHIGAYQVEFKDKTITFLDTPGHESFSAIRSRGTKVADIAVLVVAADEGVKTQTKEAIKIIEDAKIPPIVALNKIDKENANPNKVKQELAENNIMLEDWGGKTPGVEVSAKTGQGIDALLDLILLVAEMEELKADTETANGAVIESHLDRRRGCLATLLVYNGMLRVNDWIVAGPEAIRIKFMEDFRGQPIREAGPSQPVVVSGWSTPPSAGEEFILAGSREDAWAAAEKKSQLGKPALFLRETGPEKNSAKILNLIVKTDVFSSLEAIDQILKTIHSEEVGYRVIDFGIGNISGGDIKRAVSAKAAVIGFRVAWPEQLKQMAERENVPVANFAVIYELVEEVRKKMSALLEPQINRIDLGKLKVLAVFKKEAKSQIVGGKVILGKAQRGALINVLRNDRLTTTGRLGQLQSQKVDVEEVKEGSEAGIRFDFKDKNITPNMYIREGDILEIYEEEITSRSL